VIAAVALLSVSGPALATSATLNVGTDGSVSVALSAVDANGSALRYAMDGNFTPLLAELPPSERGTLATSIEAAEASPLTAGLFGNRDGTVEPSEVALFSDLIRDEAGLLPTDTFTGLGVLGLTLNGNAPGGAVFDGVTFNGAVGPDSSTAPIIVTASTSDSFLPEGTSGTLVASWNFTVTGVIALPAPNATLSVTTPNGTMIGTASGLIGVSVHNDALGWGPASASGELGPSSTGSATFSFQPAFPLGDVLIGVAAAVAIGLAAFVLWRRRRRRAAEDDDAPRS
jgi:hypothetical protein